MVVTKMTSSDYDIYKVLRAEKSKEGESRRQSALQQFRAAAALANQVGWIFACHSEIHYSLRKPQENSWILNIYPGNRRLYYDQNKAKGPYLKLKENWTLYEVVEAAIKQNNADFKMPTQEEVRDRAYFLWQKAGSPQGDGSHFWLEAERELNAKSNDYEHPHRNGRRRN